MLGLFLLYFLGKYFYDLAGKHKKKQWLFAIIGVVSYYAGTFIGGLILGTLIELKQWEVDDVAAGFLALPFGLAVTYGLYQYFKNSWAKKQLDETILDEML